MRELLDRRIAEHLSGSSLRGLEQRVAGLVARAGDEPVDGQEHGTVIRPEREHGGIDMAAREELLERTEVRHRG